MRNPYYLNRLFSEVDNGYAVSGPDGLLEQTPEQEYTVEQQNLAELDPELDEETLVHSYYPGYGYGPQTYYYSDEDLDGEGLTEEELQEEVIKQSLYDQYMAEQTRIYNANATAQALQDLGIRMYADGEEGEDLEDEDLTDEELAEAADVETIKQSLFDAWAISRMYSDDEEDEDEDYDDDDDAYEEELSEAEVVKQSLYIDYMTRLYAENELEDGEEIVHVDEFGNEVHPEVVKQALLDDYAYSRFYSDADEETEDDAEDIQDLHEDEDLDDTVDVPTATEELAEEAVKKQSSIYALEESVDALL